MSTQTYPLRGPVHWILDWDGTITKKDTLDALVNIAASTQPDYPIHDSWKHVVDAYMVDYTSSLDQLVPNSSLPTTLEGEAKLLEELKVVEQRSLDRVYDAGIFGELATEDLEAGAKKAVESGEVAIRPGCVDLLKRLSSNETAKGDKLHILSVNWSRHFISSCLKAAGVEIDPSIILANELQGIDGGHRSSGEISPVGTLKIISSADKFHQLERLKQENALPVVYVGDSWTDIDCLLAVDLGICIRDEPMGSSQKKLADAFGRLSVACPRLEDWEEAGEPGLVWGKEFEEIGQWFERNRK
jgi:2-hydroxy-3-keto-5-methylthiopentenyl-1-phosphate phosphatase